MTVGDGTGVSEPRCTAIRRGNRRRLSEIFPPISRCFDEGVAPISGKDVVVFGESAEVSWEMRQA